MKKMRVLSLCTGIGGIDLAAEAAGMVIVGQVEIDEFCNQVLEQHWPDVKRLRDLFEVQGNEFGKVNLLVAGFPCQPTSHAGKRRGAEDARWLWPEVYRIIRSCQPAWVLCENVPGLITMGLDDVLGDLASAGYEATACVYPAAAVGAPHQRERVFILGYASGFRPIQRDSIAQRDEGDASTGRRSCNGTDSHDGNVANTDSQRWQKGDAAVGSAAFQSDWNAATDAVMADAAHGGLRRGEPSRDARQPARSGEAMAYTSSRRRDGEQGQQREGSARRGWAIKDGQGVGHADAYGERLEGREASERELGRPRPTEPRQYTAGQTEPRLGESTHGLPTWLDGTHWPAGPGEAQHDWEAPRTVTGQVPNRAARLKALGNAVVPAQVYPILLAIAETWKAA